MTLTTTLAEIRSHNPCPEGFAKIRKHMGVSPDAAKTHNVPFPITLLLETNDLWHALWVFDRVALQSVKDDFLIRRLDTGEHSALKTLRSLDGDWSQQITAVEAVVSLLHRRMMGEDVSEQMRTARAAANAAANAAADAAADAAARAVRAAAYVAADAANAAYAAARAAYVAVDTADAAARADLIAACENKPFALEVI